MGLLSAVRFNMTNVADPSAQHAERYAAALDMAGYADDHGFTAVSCEEHHLAETGWLPAPLVMAAALAGRTSRVRISVNALLITLYEPLRLAEDIAVLDNLAGGRFSFVAGMGYRPEEYAATGQDWERRGEVMDHCIEVLLAAWGPEPFTYNGHPVNVTPKPLTRPHPLFLVGGMSVAAARRAARFGLPFSPPMPMPDLAAAYTAELTRLGHRGFVYAPENGSTVTLLGRDPEAMWTDYGHHILNEVREYSRWQRAGVTRPHDGAADSVAAVRERGVVEILTPEELIAQIAAGRTEVVTNPLIGGLPLDAGWESLRLLGEAVLPAVSSQ
jgi:alkanesulfonate monooxygenase SsuD/methylene tetrahydromethanopterin reductase-like flavin-dependent oxidoreductase (luciferase family)